LFLFEFYNFKKITRENKILVGNLKKSSNNKVEWKEEDLGLWRLLGYNGKIV
jgi:hypothetical protein